MGYSSVRRPLAALALGLVALEALVALLGARAPLLSAAALIAPGLALTGLLPARLRQSLLGTLTGAPALGFAVSSVALITAASLGIPLSEWAVRAVLTLLVVAGLVAVPESLTSRPLTREARLTALGLAAAVALGVALQERVIGGSPVPGNDWAKYVLYADEIRREGGLLIDNPFWMLGVPFREDPGVPALYGAFLSLTEEPASTVMHGIWFFAVAGVLSTFAFVRTLWGDLAGVLAAAFAAALPISHDILGWHGLANAGALALVPLVLLYVALLLTDGLRWRESVGFAIVVVSLAATHRLSLFVTLLAAGLALAAALLAGERRRVGRDLARVALVALLICPGVAYDLVTRGRTFEGRLPHTAYLSSKLDLGLLAGDLTLPFSLAVLASVAVTVASLRKERPLWPVYAFAFVVMALAFAWLVDFPLAYLRMAYYLPIALAPLVAVALVRALSARRAALVGAVLTVGVVVAAWPQATNVRDFYQFASPASLRGLDAVSARLKPGEIVVSDRCWSFLSAWLLHTRTLPALEPADIQPRAELAPAREARAILDGTPRGRATARRLGVRFVIADPTCADAARRPLRPPSEGKPIYVSRRLTVLELSADYGEGLRLPKRNTRPER